VLSALLPIIAVFTLVLVLPPLGALVAGQPLGQFLHLPLEARAWDALSPDPALTWVALGLTAALVALTLWLTRAQGPAVNPQGPTPRPWPAWTWVGPSLLILALGLGLDGGGTGLGHLGWPIALLGLTLILSADTQRRGGTSLLTQNRAYLAALYGAGALLGWAWYWINLYLQLWHYPQAPAPALFGVLATLAYATLLPGLLALRQWLGTLPGLRDWGRRAEPRNLDLGPGVAWPLIALGSLGLLGAGVWPDWIYPLTWLAPLSLALGMQRLSGASGLFAGVERGDWGRPLLTALAALILTLAAQAWNQWAGPLWVWEIPLIGGPRVLGLPAPGYLGGVVLGLLGLWVADQVARPWRGRSQSRFPDFPVRIMINP
jgi:hypothetical protein